MVSSLMEQVQAKEVKNVDLVWMKIVFDQSPPDEGQHVKQLKSILFKPKQTNV